MTTTIFTDTAMLRRHARDLQHIGDLVDSGAAALNDGIKEEHWANSLNVALLSSEIRPALMTFCAEFQRAHDESYARLLALAEVYHTADAGLRIVADQYDAADR